MSLYDSATRSALAAGTLILRDMVTVYGKDSDGDPVTFGFWKGEDDVTTNVVTAVDGSTVSRSFIGGGTLIEVDPIPLVIGLEARTINVKLSQIESHVQDMVRGNDIRHAVVEVFRALFDIATGASSRPRSRVSWARSMVRRSRPRQRGGRLDRSCAASSNTIDLTRTNSSRKATSSRRSGRAIGSGNMPTPPATSKSGGVRPRNRVALMPLG
jgi:hypothetical protein